MAIVEKKIRGKSYFYEVKSYREGKKIKQRILRYFGRVDPRKEPGAQPIVKYHITATYQFGDVALLYHCARSIKLIEIINKYLPKRQGLSHGLLYFLLASHRLLGYKPSAVKLKSWVEKTHLPKLLLFDMNKITKNSIQYSMNCLFDTERKIDHSFHISQDIYKKARDPSVDEDIYFYDITSTYFEGNSCPLAFLGYSRDGLADKVQINVGLIVNKNEGLPLMSKVFEGNIHDTKTVYEMVYYTQFVLKKKKVFLIMDRGMDSQDNIRLIDSTGNDFIIGLSKRHGFVRKLKLQIKHDDPGWKRHYSNGKEILLRRFTKNLFGRRLYVVMYYSADKAQTQKEMRERKITFAEQALKEKKNLTLPKARDLTNGVSKYLKISKKDNKIVWKREKVAINQAELLDGKFCMATNKDKSAKEVYDLYFSKDKVEKAFRHMKQDLDLHPTRKRLPDRVRADVFVCHLAYFLLRMVENIAQNKKMDIFWDGLSTEAKEIRLIEMEKSSGNTTYTYVANTEIQKKIVEKFKLQDYVP